MVSFRRFGCGLLASTLLTLGACAAPPDEAVGTALGAAISGQKTLDVDAKDWGHSIYTIKGEATIDFRIKRSAPDQMLGFALEVSTSDPRLSFAVDECDGSACSTYPGTLAWVAGLREYRFTPAGLPSKRSASANYRVRASFPSSFEAQMVVLWQDTHRGLNDDCVQGSTKTAEACTDGLNCNQDPTNAHAFKCQKGTAAPRTLQVVAGRTYTQTLECGGSFALDGTVGVGADNHVDLTFPKRYATRGLHLSVHMANASRTKDNPTPTVVAQECDGASCTSVNFSVTNLGDSAIYLHSPAPTKLTTSSSWKVRLDFPADFEPRLLNIWSNCTRGKDDLCDARASNVCESPLSCLPSPGSDPEAPITVCR